MPFQSVLLNLPPRRLFLIDSLGALLSALLLGLVLASFESFFGMPARVLYLLTTMAMAFFTYSLLCYWYAKKRWRLFLKWIAIVNLLYGCLTLGLVIAQWDNLSVWGLTYFVLEIAVVSGLAGVELYRAFY